MKESNGWKRIEGQEFEKGKQYLIAESFIRHNVVKGTQEFMFDSVLLTTYGKLNGFEPMEKPINEYEKLVVTPVLYMEMPELPEGFRGIGKEWT